MKRVLRQLRWIATIFFLFSFFFTGEAANYLCFTAESEEASFFMANVGGNSPDVHYSINGGISWETLASREDVTLKKGDKIYVKGNNPQGFSSGEEVYL